MKQAVGAGLDIGTSGLKCTIFDVNGGSVIGHRRLDYGFETESGVVPAARYTEALEQFLGGLAGEFALRGVAVTTAWYSVIGTENGTEVVYQWNSPWERDAAVEAELPRYLEHAGVDLDTRFPVYKLLTAKLRGDNAFKPYGIKEYLLHWLTGRRVTDFSTASASGLADYTTKGWNGLLLERLGRRPADLPEIARHNSIVGEARINGQTVAVAPGLGDGGAASYGCQAVSDVAGNIGTSMAVRELAPAVRRDPAARLWTFMVDEQRYLNGDLTSNGCSVLNWARKLGWPIDEVSVEHGPEACFPWLHGERLPFYDTNPRGTFTGLDLRSDGAALAAAIVKGVAFNFSRMVNTVTRGRASNDGGVVVAGGGLHLAELLRVIQGSVDVPLSILKSYDYLAAEGAARSLAEALGLPALDLNHEMETVLEPNGEFRADYEGWLAEGDRLARDIYRTAP